MKKASLVLAFSVMACGKTATDQKKGVYFVPRAALSALGGGSVQVVGSHDSGLLVEASDPGTEAALARTQDAFRFDDFSPEFTLYNFASMERRVKELAAAYPNLATLETYGTSRRGRPEYVFTVGNKSDEAAKPELMITAATHGNEVITVDVALGLIEKLLKGYNQDQRITDMVNQHTLHFIPAVCVDSYEAQTREADGRDPNRDYAYPESPSRQPGAGCIRDIVTYFHSKDIVGSMDYHSAASMIMFPWAYTYDHIPQPDYSKLDDLTTKMAESNGFAHGDIASTIYVAKGSSADYYYWKHHTMATAVEVSHNLAATSTRTDDIVEENTESTWVFIESFH